MKAYWIHGIVPPLCYPNWVHEQISQKTTSKGSENNFEQYQLSIGKALHYQRMRSPATNTNYPFSIQSNNSCCSVNLFLGRTKLKTRIRAGDFPSRVRFVSDPSPSFSRFIQKRCQFNFARLDTDTNGSKSVNWGLGLVSRSSMEMERTNLRTSVPLYGQQKCCCCWSCCCCCCISCCC